MPMRRKLYDPLSKAELAAIHKSWKHNDPDAYRWIGRLVKEIEQLHKRADELKRIYFITNGVEIETVSPTKAAKIYDEAVARRDRRLAGVA